LPADQDPKATSFHLLQQRLVYLMLNSVNDVFDEVTVILTQNKSISYLADIKQKTLQAVSKQLKGFNDAILKLAAEKQERKCYILLFLSCTNYTPRCRRRLQNIDFNRKSDIAELCTESATGVKTNVCPSLHGITVLPQFPILHFYIIPLCCVDIPARDRQRDRWT